MNASNTLVDDIWAWRADHGNPGTVGWTVNTAAHGLVVNGNNVLATGLFVEHYQNYEVQWGRRRRESNPCTGLCRPLPKPLGHSAARAYGPSRADDGIRTRDPHLGKVMLYQLSHVRVATPWGVRSEL